MKNFNRDNIILLSGTANPGLAIDICAVLEVPLAKTHVRRFSDGETFVEIGQNVRGKDVFLIQSTSAPANDNLMELLIMVDALKRASAGSITAVVPYYGYARQDRKVAPRTPITAKLVADLFYAAGVDRVVSLDLHAGQLQGFFNIPTDNLYSMPVALKYVRERIMPLGGPVVIVSPDAGGVERARAFAKRLDASVAMIDKRRTAPNVAKAMHLVGNVQDHIAIILDDMIDTAGTLAQAAEAVLKHGATKVFACSTHGVLSGPALERIMECPIEKVMVTDTIAQARNIEKCSKLDVVSVAPLLAHAIARIHAHGSLSELFI